MEQTCSIAGVGTAADVTGMTRLCSDLLSRVDDFVWRIDEIHNNIANTHECCQLIDKVQYGTLYGFRSIPIVCDCCVRTVADTFLR